MTFTYEVPLLLVQSVAVLPLCAAAWILSLWLGRFRLPRWIEFALNVLIFSGYYAACRPVWRWLEFIAEYGQ